MKTAAIEKLDHQDYFNIAVSVDCVIFGYDNKELKVLLIKSDLKEFEGKYSLLGDLVRLDEDLEDAPYRVLKQRTGLTDVFLEQVSSFGTINRHPSGRVITIAYYSLVNTKSHKLQLTDNELRWHRVADIKDLAFDHYLILQTCWKQLQEKVMEQPIVFNLLTEKFSMRQLQDVYEEVLSCTLDRRNFRKRIMLKDWITPLDELEVDVPHRPGMLFKKKKSNSKKPVPLFGELISDN